MSNLPDSEMKAHAGVAGSAKPVRQLATYLVLTKSGGSWREIGPIDARDPEAAIRAVALELEESSQDGTFVAVVASRWNPVTITAKVERSLELTPVKP